MENSIYDGKFFGNILVVGRTECGKTTFIQNLAINNFFGKLVKVKWVSGIRLNKQREAEIESNFNCEVKFDYPHDKEELAQNIEEYKLESESENDYENNDNVNIFGEEKKRDGLIVFDDVSGLADESKKFTSFLTVARKYKYNCIYVFHTIYTEKSNWKTILSQTNIFNIFPASIPINSVKKILELSCIRKTSKYIPQSSLWISRLFIELANENDKVCLTIDCSNKNKDGPSKFRTKADNPESQFCYFNSVNDEQVFNQFVSKRINSEVVNEKESHYFKITEVVSKSDKSVKFKAENKLKELNNGAKTSGLQKLIFQEQERETKERLQVNQQSAQLIPKKTMNFPLSQTMQSLEKELNLDIFLNDKDLKKQKKKYSSTKIKARNFLTNVSYSGVKNGDFENRSFVLDIFAYLILYFNPYNLDEKFETEVEKDYVNILWSMLLPANFYNFVSREENIKSLNKTNAKFQEALEIVKVFIENVDNEGLTQEQQHNSLKEYLTSYAKMYRLIFANLFPKYFSKIDNYGINAKIEFNTFYKNYLNQKTVADWDKQNQYWEEIISKNKETQSSSLELNDNSEIEEKKVEVITIKEEPIDEKKIKKQKKEKKKNDNWKKDWKKTLKKLNEQKK